MSHKKNILPADGKLGILIPGLGAVSTTFIAGTIAVRKGMGLPIGSITQMGKIRLGKRTENRNPAINDFVPLASINDLVFGGWDITPDNAWEAAMKAGVLNKELLEDLKEELELIQPMRAVFDHAYVKNLDGEHVKNEKTKMDSAKALITDIKEFKEKNGCQRLVMVWCASTEVYVEQQDIHLDLLRFEKALEENHPAIAPSMIYAYAAIKSGVPFVNGAPNLTCDVPAIVKLANDLNVPIAGKDFKTGQTLMKTILGPGLKTRLIGIDGWFSTNILGNRDGKVLDDTDSFKTKEVSKLSVLESILEADLYPELYKEMYHKVRINYYPPKGDDKESWDNLDVFGWLGYKMQIKVNFLCKDSILAAPIVLDLALFVDLAHRAQMKGIQEWLSFYFKAPQTLQGLQPIHDIFQQKIKLENTLRYLMGENLINHLGLDYYEEKE
ncbi:MAG: inositol-3-phosphate synthase [Bacteroidales bacterium]|jgi:myo-inositol-1-phosphate synthase|nr:inositol-3-phosphate synthase [Bacteroidales bacterium]MDD3700747.1 inositol-3-phosphate synthase [Bacteroidales bacterium]MDY0369361.1 inositol-3-phosphate synthase [Bacteroidales bacterium]